MPQDRLTGAAWDHTAADFDSALELGGSGLAWQFLRRNDHYRQDCALCGGCMTVAGQLASGARLYEIVGPDERARGWGLQAFVDPDCHVGGAPLFWLPELLTRCASCTAQPATSVKDSVTLASFGPQAKLLRTEKFEQLLVPGGSQTVQLYINCGSLLSDRFALTFWHEGLATAARHAATLQCLNQVMRGNGHAAAPSLYSKYRDYLIALDGHLAGCSYRDIAEKLYGPGRVSTHWSEDTRWMKSKVRRAVERGIALMNGGYRELL